MTLFIAGTRDEKGANRANFSPNKSCLSFVSGFSLIRFTIQQAQQKKKKNHCQRFITEGHNYSQKLTMTNFVREKKSHTTSHY